MSGKPDEYAVSPRIAAIVCAALSLLYYGSALLPDRQIFGVDYLSAGYFIQDFIAHRIADGEMPRWIPHIFGGVPVQANPGSTFYPIRVLLDPILPTVRVFPLLLIVQFAVAGIGMYALARELGARSWVALVTALAFEFTGITMSFVWAGHDGRIIVATLAPLLFAALHRGIRTGEIAPFVGAAATLGFALLSFQIQSTYYLLLGASMWSVFAIVRYRVWKRPAALLRTLALGMGAVAFAFTMASVNFLPFLRYVPDSPRPPGGRGYEHATSYSMPIVETVGMAVPEQFGYMDDYRGSNDFKLHTEYVGALVLMLLVLGAIVSRRDAVWWFFVGLALFALSISYGGNTPLYRIYYEVLPGNKQFRAPSIAFFVVALSLVAMAGVTLERLAALRQRMRGKASGQEEGDRGRMELLKRVLLVVVVASGAAMLISAMMATSGGGSPAAIGWARFTLVLAIFAGLTWLWMSAGMSSRAALIAFSVLCVADLWIIDHNFFATEMPPEDLFAADEIAQFLRTNAQGERVWVFPFPLDGSAGYRGNGRMPVTSNYLMNFGVEQAGGEHGNQLQRWNQYVGAGQGRRLLDWHNFIQRSAILDAANVRYIVSAVDLRRMHATDSGGAGGMQPVLEGNTAVVFRNPDALPRAYLVSQARLAPDEGTSMDMLRDVRWDPRTVAIVNGTEDPRLPGGPSPGFATIETYEPDHVLIRTQGQRAGLLVLADNYMQGWTATVDGSPTRLYRVNHAFRGVRVDAGAHVVEMRFYPPGLRTGFIAYVISLALLALYGVAELVRRRPRRQRATPGPAAA